MIKSSIMAEYRDYGYINNEPDHTFFYLRPALFSMLDKDINRWILDVGCGNGYLASELLKAGYNVYGTDASEKGIAIAKQQHPGRFFVQDISTGGLPPELEALKFNTIISTEVIEHLYDPEGFVEFCKTVIKKNGELIISTPYHGYLKNLVLSVFNKWDDHLGPTWRGGHIKFWSRKTLSQLLTDKGFTIIAFRGCGRFPFFWKSMVIKAKLL